MESKFGILCALVLAFVLRLWVAWTGDFLLHPDEVFQYLEQGHRVVFGYGIVPWEYRYGTRSWLLAGSIAVLLWPLKWLGWDTPNVYLPWIKFVFCAFSMTIPVGMMFFSRRHLGEKAAFLAVIFGGFWYELLVFAHKPLPGMVATGWLFLALGIGWDDRSVRRAWGVGLCLGLCVGLRVQFVPLVVGVAMVAMYRASWRVRLHLCAASSVVVLGVGALDAVTWGGWWHSYFASVRFNVSHGVASQFGVEPVWYFFWGVGVASFGLVGVVLALFLWCRPAWGWFALGGMLLVLVPHSLIGHKEYRFVFPMIPMWLLLLAICLAFASRWVQRVVVGSFLLIALLGITNRLPKQDQLYDAKEWALLRDKGRITHLPFRFLERRADLAMAREISRHTEIRGVWMAVNSWDFTGGYAYLHRKVPLYGVRLPRWIEPRELGRYVTHVVWKANSSPLMRVFLEHQGFVEKARFGEIVLHTKKPKHPMVVWCHHTKHVAFVPVDFRFRPVVWPVALEIAEGAEHCVRGKSTDRMIERSGLRVCRIRKERRHPLF